MATKRLREWFFLVTSVLRADGTIGGIRFRKSDKPTQGTYEDFAASITFSKESSDRAKPYTASSDLSTEQGLAVLATDVQAKAGTTQLSDRSLVISPSQLPTSETLNNTAFEDFSAQVTDVIIEGSTSTRNRYQVRLLPAWLTTLYSRVFKQGGLAAHVPIKNSGTNYDWSWGDLSQNSTFYTNLAANNSFTTLLANSANFVSTLVANNSFTTALANNNNFYTTLGNNTSFISVLTANSTFITNIQTSVVSVAKSITKVAGALELVNDATTPGNYKFYGTEGTGTKGYQSLVTTYTDSMVAGDFTWSDVDYSTTSISGAITSIVIGKTAILNYNMDLVVNNLGTAAPETVTLYMKLPNSFVRTATMVTAASAGSAATLYIEEGVGTGGASTTQLSASVRAIVSSGGLALPLRFQIVITLA